MHVYHFSSPRRISLIFPRWRGTKESNEFVSRPIFPFLPRLFFCSPSSSFLSPSRSLFVYLSPTSDGVYSPDTRATACQRRYRGISTFLPFSPWTFFLDQRGQRKPRKTSSDEISCKKPFEAEYSDILEAGIQSINAFATVVLVAGCKF